MYAHLPLKLFHGLHTRVLHSCARVLSSSFMRSWSLRAPETVRLASSVLSVLLCCDSLYSCPRSPALDLKDFPSNSSNGVCNCFLSPETERSPLRCLCRLPVSWLTCPCPAARAPLARAGARSALRSLTLILFLQASAAFCCLGVFARGQASSSQNLSCRLEAHPTDGLVLGYKVGDDSKITRGCQNSWLYSVNVYFPFCFLGFVLNAHLYLHLSRERIPQSTLAVTLPFPNRNLLLMSHPFSSIPSPFYRSLHCSRRGHSGICAKVAGLRHGRVEDVSPFV